MMIINYYAKNYHFLSLKNIQKHPLQDPKQQSDAKQQE